MADYKKYLAEAIGTFFLVFCGPGAMMVHDLYGSVGHIGIGLCFGIIVTVMIYCFGSVSGAHINPAVTIAFSFTRLFPKRLALGYILSQCIGAILASGLLGWLLQPTSEWGQTLPHAGVGASFGFELVLTFLLMLVILGVSTQKKIAEYTAPAVGATVALAALFAGPLCGASMNPARSLAPALFAGTMDSLWLYIIAPILGAVLATVVWKVFGK